MHWGEPVLRVLALLTPKASGARRGDWPCWMTTVRSPQVPFRKHSLPPSRFRGAPRTAGWLTRDAAPTPDPPAHNCLQILPVHSDAGTAQGLQGTRPVFISKLVLVGEAAGGWGQQGNLRPHWLGTRDVQSGGARALLVDTLARALLGTPSLMDSAWPLRNTQSRGFPCGLGVGVWWTGEGALQAPEYPLPGAGPPVA